MDTIKQLSIKEASGTSYIDRDIGAEAQNIEVSYDASGNIINDINASGVVIDHTQGVSKTFNDFKANIDEKSPTNHASSETTYGVASTTQYGHMKVGTGLEVSNGTVSVSYGTGANTSCQGNDTRLSNSRTTPNSLTFNNGGSGDGSGTTFNGSAAKTISYNTIGAAPASHVSTTASASNLGHVKIGTGINNSNGTISVAYGNSSTTACIGNDTRLSDARTPKVHYSSAASTYGAGTSSQFGHVKLSDSYTSSAGNANASIGASSYAVAQVYTIANGKAPTSHASSQDTYGKGNATNYGHVKLSDTYTSNVGAASSGIAASQYAVYQTYNYFAGWVGNIDRFRVYEDGWVKTESNGITFIEFNGPVVLISFNGKGGYWTKRGWNATNAKTEWGILTEQINEYHSCDFSYFCTGSTTSVLPKTKSMTLPAGTEGSPSAFTTEKFLYSTIHY